MEFLVEFAVILKWVILFASLFFSIWYEQPGIVTWLVALIGLMWLEKYEVK